MGHRHKMLAFFLVGAMFLGILPVSAAEAEDTDVQVEADGGDDAYYDPEDPGNYRLAGKAEEASFGSAVSALAVSQSKYNDCYIEKGIDVSYYNGTINWEKVKNDEKGKFAIIRVAYRGYSNGALKTDVKAEENLRNANAVGVPIGAYIFSQAVTIDEAVEEADYIVDRVAGYQIDLPIVLDYEYVAVGVGRLYNAKLSKETATDICVAFCDRVKERGYTPMVYANKSMLSSSLYAADFSQDSAVWLAHYTDSTDYAGEYEFWQYSSSGSVAGVTGNGGKTDVNFRYVNLLRISGRSPTSLSLSWQPYTSGGTYEVWRKNGSAYELLSGVGSATTFTDTGLSPGSSYSYKIYEAGADGTKKCIGFNTGITDITVTTSASAQTAGFDKVKVSWLTAAGAKGYIVQRAAGGSTVYKTVASTSATSYKDKNRDAATLYKYQVLPYKEVFNGRSKGIPSNEAEAATLASIKGKTKASNLALRKKASASSKKLGTIKKKGAKVTITGSSGSWYKVSVKINGVKKTGYLKKSRVNADDPSTIGKVSLSIKSKAANKVKIGWKKVSKASGYEIQRYNQGTKQYETVKTIKKGSKVSWTDSGLEENTKYKYRVRAYRTYAGIKFNGAYSSVKSAKTLG